MGKKKPKSLDDFVSDAIYDAQIEMGKRTEQHIGSEIERFIGQDELYVGVLLISGILLLAGTQLDTSFVGILLTFYQLLLVLTAVSYVYLRLVRKKRYNEGENGAISLAGNWLIHSAAGIVVVFMVELFIIITILEKIGVYAYPLDTAVTVAAGVLVGSAVFLKRNHHGERADTFAVMMADGVAWVAVLGGIGALGLLDSAYSILLLLHWLAFPVY